MNPQTAAIDTLLFDWDGTIVDSAQLGLTAFEQSFAALGRDFDHEIYRQVYSPNWYSVYEAMGLPKENGNRPTTFGFITTANKSPQPVAGRTKTINELKRKGYRLGVVSSGTECRVAREIKQLGLENAFEIVICNEQMTNKKPHPEGLETAMRSLGCACEHAAT